MQVRLRPGLRRAWRSPGTVQLGVNPAHATVLDGLTPDDRAFLEQLVHGVDLPEETGPDTDRPVPRCVRGGSGDPGRLLAPVPEAPGRRVGINNTASPDLRRRHLVQLITEAGMIAEDSGHRDDFPVTASGTDAVTHRRWDPDEAIWALACPGCGDGWRLRHRRAGLPVLIRGAGRLGTTLSVLLAAQGVPVEVIDPRPVASGDLLPGGARLADLGETRQDAARAAISRVGGAVPATGARLRPALVVLVDHAVADPVVGDDLLRADLPHLSVVVRETGVMIGPLVRPGHAPCLRCLDLHRTDRDPQWPVVLAQFTARGHDPWEPEESTLATLAASTAALQVLAHLDARTQPASVAATLEIELPDGLTVRRPWPAHPGCGCHWHPDAPHLAER